MKKTFIAALTMVILGGALFIYLYYFYFNIERTNLLRRTVDVYTGQNLTVTIFSLDGSILKQWRSVKKITTGQGEGRNYTFFYTQEGKYVQIPNSVYYIAEEQ